MGVTVDFGGCHCFWKIWGEGKRKIAGFVGGKLDFLPPPQHFNNLIIFVLEESYGVKCISLRRSFVTSLFQCLKYAGKARNLLRLRSGDHWFLRVIEFRFFWKITENRK